ncbi:hypothetical protein CEXT_526801 [Caerostris extrusa]|uniref:Uncharacterized protein n=1 Tax=Caerostris extrusa TaxID=172846 RepID=A0AAV4QDZ0_CAEEX|nr:hypothetical protein CEXT_526801 [Caerostris extrusa]
MKPCLHEYSPTIGRYLHLVSTTKCMDVIIAEPIGGALIDIPSSPPMHGRAQTDSPKTLLRCSRIHDRCGKSDGLLFAEKAILTLGCKSPSSMHSPTEPTNPYRTENKISLSTSDGNN